jgi:fluoride ion exporter CrcB/FEX
VLLWIALGGAAGSVARYGVGLVTDRLTATWPIGTLIVNGLSILAMILGTTAARAISA